MNIIVNNEKNMNRMDRSLRNVFFSIFLSDISKCEYNAVLFTLHIDNFLTIQILQHHIMLPLFFSYAMTNTILLKVQNWP